MQYVSLPSVDQDQTSLTIFPCQGEPRAVLIWIHGGGWIKGDRRRVRRMPAFFGDQQILFVSVNYPLTSSDEIALIDQQIMALQGLDQWLKENSQKDLYPHAFSSITILAHSSGAHLVALMDKRYGWNESVKSLILMDSGAYDMSARFEHARPAQKRLFAQISRLDLYPTNQHSAILRSYSPALLPSRPRSHQSLNVIIVSSQRPGALFSARRLMQSYSADQYHCSLHQYAWGHEFFPDAVGVDSSLNALILEAVFSPHD